MILAGILPGLLSQRNERGLMKFILGWSLFKEQFADNLELDGVLIIIS